MTLCDDTLETDITKCHVIESGDEDAVTLNPGSFIVFYFDNKPDLGPLHVGHKLGGGGDAVYLVSADGELLDSIQYTDVEGMSVDDVSLGRSPDGGADWVKFGVGLQGMPSPGVSNVPAVENSAPVIGEMSHYPQEVFADSVVTVEVEVTDAEDNLEKVTLAYGVDAAPEVEVEMELDGPLWSTSIGPFTAGAVIKYSITAKDAQGAVTDSEVLQFQVTGPANDGW